MPETGAVVKRIQIEATGSAEVQAELQRISSSFAATRSEIEAQGKGINAAVSQTESGVRSSATGIASSFSSIQSKVGSAVTAIGGSLGKLEAASFTSWEKVGDDAVQGAAYVDSAATKVEESVGRIKTSLRSVGSEDFASSVDTQLSGISQKADDTEPAVSRVKGSLDRIGTADFAPGVDSQLSRVAGKADETYAQIDAIAADSSKARAASEYEYEKAVLSADQAILNSERILARERVAIAQQAASERAAADKAAAEQSVAANKEASGGFMSSVGRSAGSLKSTGRETMMAGLGLIAAPIGALYEAGSFYGQGQTTAGNLNLNPAQTRSMDAEVLKLTAAGNVASKTIFDSYLHAISIFPKATGPQLKAIIEDAWKSAIGSGGSESVITDALARAMHNWNLGPEMASRTMDVIHSIAARGDMKLEDLAGNMGKSSALASTIGVSIPQWGALFDVLTKQFGAPRTDTYLQGLFQKINSQTPAAQKELAAMGLSKEFSPTGVEKLGIFKVLTDFIDKLQQMGPDAGNRALQKIVPGTRGGLAITALERPGHLSEAENINSYLGGSSAGGGPAAGTGGQVGGITDRMFEQMEKQLSFQTKKMVNDVKVMAVEIGAALIPAAQSVLKGMLPIVQAFGSFLKDHPAIVKAAIEIGGALVGIGGLAWVAGTLLAFNPVVGIIVALAAGFILAYNNSKPFHDTVDSLAKSTLPVLKTALSDVWSILQRLGSFLGQFASDFKSAFEKSPEYAASLKQVKAGLDDIWHAIEPVLKDLGLFDTSSGHARDQASSLATVLNGALRLAVSGLGTVFKTAADVIVTAIDLVSNIVRTAADVIKNTFKIIGDDVTLLSDLIHGRWSKIGADTQKLKDDVTGLWTTLVADVLRLVGQLGTDLLRLVGDAVSGVVHFFQTLYDELVGHSLIPDLIRAIVTWFTNLPGMLAGALGDLLKRVMDTFKTLASDIASWAGDLGHKFLGWAGDWAGKLASGITVNAGKIKDALMTAVQNAANSAGSWLSSHNPLNAIGNFAGSHNPLSGGSSSTGGGGAFGLTGVGGTVFSSTAGESSLLGGRTPIADLDYLLPKGAQETITLPGAKDAVYKLVSAAFAAGIGGIEQFIGPSGNRFALLHLSQLAPTGTYHGGDTVGKTGWPTSPEFGNGVAGPANAQLCVVYDSGGNPVAIVPQSLVTRGRGGGLGGIGTTTGNQSLIDSLAAGSTKSANGFVTNPSQAPGAFSSEASTIASLDATIKSLPPMLQTQFMGPLQNLAGEWKQDQATFAQKLSDIDTQDAQKLGDLEKSHAEALQHAMADHGIKISSALAQHAVSEAAHVAAETAALQSHAESVRHTLADFGIQQTGANAKFLLQQASIYAKGGSGMADAIKKVEDEFGISRSKAEALLSESLQHSANDFSIANQKRTAAENAFAQKWGISSKEAASLFNESMRHMNAQFALSVTKLGQAHDKHIHDLYLWLTAHVNALHGELTKLQKSITAAQAPDKMWDTLVKGVKDTLSKDTKSMSYLAVAGQPITTTKPASGAAGPNGAGQGIVGTVTGDKLLLAPRTLMILPPGDHDNPEKQAPPQASVNTGPNGSRLDTMPAPADNVLASASSRVGTAVETVAQQMEKWAKDAAVSVLKQEALNTVLAASTSLVDLFGGKLSDFATQLGAVRTMWTEQVLADAVQGRAVNQTYLDNIAQVDQGLKDAATAQVGLTAVVAVNEHSFSGMKTAADSLYQDTLPRWEDAMVESGSAQNQYTSGLVQSAAAQKAFGVASDAENVIVGQLTGNLGLLDSGLKAFASKAVDAITLWATNLGRIGGDAANSGLSILKLGQDSTQAADSLGTLPDIISGLTTATSAIEAAAETQFARTGSIDPATLSAYGNAQGQVTSATYDQYGAQLLLYRSTGDLNNYYQVLGKEISSLQQTTIPELTAKYGANSTQVQAATATLKTLQTEYTGLGDELKILGGDTTLTGDQVAAAGKAFAVFTGTGIDPAILAAQQFGAIITAGLNPQQQFNDNTATGAQAVQTLGTNALSTASDLLTLDTSISTVVGAFAAAVVAIKAAASASGSSGSTSSSTGTSLSSGPKQGTFGTAGLTDTSGLAGIGGSVTIPAGYAWATYNGQQVLEPIGASAPPNGTIAINGQQVPIYTPPTTAGTLNLGTNPNPAPVTTAATTTTAPTGQTVSLGGGSSGYMLNGTVYMPGSQPVAGMVVANDGTLVPFGTGAGQATGNYEIFPGMPGGSAVAPSSSVGSGLTYQGGSSAGSGTTATSTSGYVPYTPLQTTGGIFGSNGPSLGTTTGGLPYTANPATGTGPGYRQWNALGSTQAMADRTLIETYGIDPAAFWAMDYDGQRSVIYGNTGASNVGAWKGTGALSGTGTMERMAAAYGDPYYANSPWSQQISLLNGGGTGSAAGSTPVDTSAAPTQPTSWDPSTSTLLPGGLTSFAQRQLSGSEPSSRVFNLLVSILSVLQQEIGGQVKLTSDRMEQLIKQGEDLMHHPMTFHPGQGDETTFDTLTRLRPA